MVDKNRVEGAVEQAVGKVEETVVEEREIAELMLRPEPYVAQVKLAPDAVKNFYEANKKRFEMPEQVRAETAKDVFEIPAGGLRIEGRVGDARIPQGQISFELYKGSQFEPGDKRPIATAIMTGDMVLLPEGTYHIVSNYGDANSTVRSDIRVEVGKLTDTTVNHRAAIITLKLVNERADAAGEIGQLKNENSAEVFSPVREEEVLRNVIEANIRSLRRKLGDHAGEIETVRGIGYRFHRPT